VTTLLDLFATHELLGWLAVGAVFLTVELATGSGWLLWPAGSAAAVGLVTLVWRPDMPVQAAVFAVLTIVSTYVGRRFINRSGRHGQDPNDPHARLIGKAGNAATEFRDGQGRVFVDGKEWSAELDGAGPLPVGARIEVVALVGGARLKVRAA
jgi:membrane protein implicated in regulation of membrane protease activity